MSTSRPAASASGDPSPRSAASTCPISALIELARAFKKRLSDPRLLTWVFGWWSRLVSNQRPSACEADALPLSYETGDLPRRRVIERAERRRRLAREDTSTESA